MFSTLAATAAIGSTEDRTRVEADPTKRLKSRPDRRNVTTFRRSFSGASGRIEPIHWGYEAVLSAPQSAVDRIAAAFEIAGPLPIDPGRVTLRVQRDVRSSEWHSRFLADARTRDPGLLRSRQPAAPAA